MSKRRFKSKADLENAWIDYKKDCDSKKITSEIVSTKELIAAEVKFRRPITYTIEGFCVFAGLSRQAFYMDYANNDKYRNIVDRMREECEVDQRTKFEQGVINPKLAGMWMSRYEGYAQKIEQKEEIKNAVTIMYDGELNDFAE